MTATNDFRRLASGAATGFSDEQKKFPALVDCFEGPTVTSDGSLWAAISADGHCHCDRSPSSQRRAAP
ncbi:MAG: hypothetical protein V5B60_09785 [Accumulibacter sp.]|uniref:hypothetical protein n=1 Tax=Accumulibacter sp. TaxID=2053492 RepID=UPI002FC2F083